MKWFLAGLAVVSVISAPCIYAETLWQEDFSDVSDWTVIYNPDEGSPVTASIGVSHGIGNFYVDKAKSEAAFGPVQSEATQTPFDPSKAAEYIVIWKISNVTGSVGWDLAIDEFDADRKFVNTVWQIFPKEGNCASTGEFSKNLGAWSWNPQTKYIAPKLNVHTGDGKQSIYIDYIKIDRVKK